MTQPKGVQRYMAVKRNLELGTEEDPIVPSYFAEQFMIRTPWETKGSKMYGTIDLPFKDPFKLTDPGQMLGMVTPMIKTPFEAWAGEAVLLGRAPEGHALRGTWCLVEDPWLHAGPVPHG